MKKFKFAIAACIISALGIVQPIAAQLQLPQPSPSATVTQTAGLTEISVEYSSPGVKGRKIYGELVPYHKMWRTGANAPTKISFSRDVTILGNKIPKGKYALLTIPNEGEFTIILNKDLNVTPEEYKQADELVRFDVKASPCEFRERLAFIFSNFNDSQTTIDIEWEKTRASINVILDTEMQSLDNIEKELGKTWRTYNSAARYYLDNKKELETGMKYVNQSISLKEDWFNVWTKAQLYNLMNNSSEAYKHAVKAKELGDKSSNFFFKDQVEKAIIEWKPALDKKK